MNWILLVENKKQDTSAKLSEFFGLTQAELKANDLPNVVYGEKKFDAIVCDKKGNEGLEMEIADFFSPNDVFFILHNTDDQIGVYTYQSGTIRQRLKEEPMSFLRESGVFIQYDSFAPKYENRINEVKTVCIIENSTTQIVRDILRVENKPGLHIKSLDNEHVMYYSEYGNIVLSVYNLMEKLDGPIYFVHSEPTNKRFSCTVFEDGNEIGIYEYPNYETDHIKELKSILGNERPLEIVKALNITPELLGF
ncbi:hypothetical protein KO493_05800 [Tamlana agarivorans]|uniref:Uncharacterized protein n=1 Tax=Pseudotamlana agarivorans TaxID=481183 RepID=A0ACC5U7A6_9FLAO|nr:hypothetical protein [Tamlana agarivorans]MBU2950202.1 hypothetical protein [Tamlana agarivorans]